MLVYLNAFANVLKSTYGSNLSINILIVGGSAIALKDGYRNATVDIDSCIDFPYNISDAIRYVARAYNIYEDWLNQDFMYSESYSNRLFVNAKYYTTLEGILHIYLVDDLAQLCMKATAYRKKDISDIRYLITILKQRGITYEMFLQRFSFLYGDYVVMKLSAQRGIERLFKRL